MFINRRHHYHHLWSSSATADRSRARSRRQQRRRKEYRGRDTTAARRESFALIATDSTFETSTAPIFSHFARLILFLFPPLPSLTWTVTWHRMSSFAVHVSVCALLAVDLNNSKGGSGFGRFSKGHDVR